MRVKDDLDFILFLNESVAFLICALFFLYANGVSTIQVVDKYKDCYIQDDLKTGMYETLTGSNSEVLFSNYRDSIIQKNKWIPFINFCLYFYFIPLINLFYFFYCIFSHKLANPFRPKDLYNPFPSNN